MKRVIAYLRECLQLLYWVFFKPTSLRRHINQIAPGYEEGLLKAERTRWGRASVTIGELRQNPSLRDFAFKTLLDIIVTPFLLYGIIGLSITAFGGHFNWHEGLRVVAFGVAVGVAVGVAGGVAGGVAFGVAFGVAGGVAVGVAFGLLGAP